MEQPPLPTLDTETNQGTTRAEKTSIQQEMDAFFEVDSLKKVFDTWTVSLPNAFDTWLKSLEESPQAEQAGVAEERQPPLIAPIQSVVTEPRQLEQKQAQAAALYSEAEVAMAFEEWTIAIEKLEQALTIAEEFHADALALLRRAQQQQELATLYASGQKHYQAGQWPEALRQFQQLQEIKRDYKDVGLLISILQDIIPKEETVALSPVPQAAPEATSAPAVRKRSQARIIRATKPGPRQKAAQSTVSLKWVVSGVAALFLLLIPTIYYFPKLPSFRGSAANATSNDVNAAARHAENADKFAAEQKWAEAAAEYEEALLLRPDDAQLHYKYGQALGWLSMWLEAEAQYRRAVELEPNNAQWHNDLGKVLVFLNKWEDAVAAHKKAVELEPNNAKWHNNLGVVLMWMNKWSEAEAHYREALRLDPKNIEYQNNIKSLGYATKPWDIMKANGGSSK